MVNKTFVSDAELLKNAIDHHGLPIVLTAILGRNFRVQIPISNNLINSDLTPLNLSCRSGNALMRSSITTVGALVACIENDGLMKIRNLGTKSIKEIKTKLLTTAYNELSPTEQVKFCGKLLKLNY